MAKNPFMHFVQDLEKEAEDFLRKYECADAIDTPRYSRYCNKTDVLGYRGYGIPFL